jgi:hypothetical protein
MKSRSAEERRLHKRQLITAASLSVALVVVHVINVVPHAGIEVKINPLWVFLFP